MARDPWASPRVILFAPPFSFHFTIHIKNIFKKILKNLLTLSFWKSRIIFALQEKHIRLLFEN